MHLHTHPSQVPPRRRLYTENYLDKSPIQSALGTMLPLGIPDSMTISWRSYKIQERRYITSMIFITQYKTT